MALGNNSNGQITYGWGDGTVNHGRRTVANLQLGKWYQLDLVHRPGSKMQMYVNGQLDSEMADTSAPITSTEPIRLGADKFGSFTNTRYDEFAVYNRDLTSDEIAARYQAGIAGSTCDKVASPTGSDTAAGTFSAPYKTPRTLVDSLATGQAGCLRGGTYDLAEQLIMEGPATNITLRSYPGERAKLNGAVAVKTSGGRLESMDLDGYCAAGSLCGISPLIRAPNVVISDNDITNRNSSICVISGAQGSFLPDNFLVERNRIHNCGRLPATNHDHGIYISDSTSGTIRNNAIYDNADRGVQLYPNAKNIQIYNNTIDGNGQGVNFGETSANNVYHDNVITNSNLRWNAEWYALTGTGNVIRDNCLYATNPGHTADGGIQDYDRDRVTLTNNTVGDPRYVNRAGKDFRLQSGSPCAGKGAPADVAAPRP